MPITPPLTVTDEYLAAILATQKEILAELRKQSGADKAPAAGLVELREPNAARPSNNFAKKGHRS